MALCLDRWIAANVRSSYNRSLTKWNAMMTI